MQYNIPLVKNERWEDPWRFLEMIIAFIITSQEGDAAS